MPHLIYIDMDDTLCDFSGAHAKAKEENPDLEWPQAQEGFFLNLEPKTWAIESVDILARNHVVKILTAPSLYNDHCWTEKAQWIRKHFGQSFLKNLIISFDKSLLKGDYLIDDQPQSHNQHLFGGTHIIFGSSSYSSWISIMEFFKLNLICGVQKSKGQPPIISWRLPMPIEIIIGLSIAGIATLLAIATFIYKQVIKEIEKNKKKLEDNKPVVIEEEIKCTDDKTIDFVKILLLENLENPNWADFYAWPTGSEEETYAFRKEGVLRITRKCPNLYNRFNIKIEFYHSEKRWSCERTLSHDALTLTPGDDYVDSITDSEYQERLRNGYIENYKEVYVIDDSKTIQLRSPLIDDFLRQFHSIIRQYMNAQKFGLDFKAVLPDDELPKLKELQEVIDVRKKETNPNSLEDFLFHPRRDNPHDHQ